MKNNSKAILWILICTLLVSFAQVLLKIGSDSFFLSWMQIYNYHLLGGVFLYVFGAFCFIYAFRYGELSLVYPISAFGYVLVVLLSIFFFAEEITIKKWWGIALIMSGIILIGRGGQK